MSRAAYKQAGVCVNWLIHVIAAAPVRIAFFMCLATMVIGGALYSLFEDGADWVDGMYWTLVVMPTVGFGDFSPETIPGRWLYVAVMLIGVFATIIAGGAFAAKIIEVQLEKSHDTPELDDDLDRVIQNVTAELNAIKVRVKHPLVEEALNKVHQEYMSTK